jgi:Domain of unknown function (DUF4034)
MRYQHTFHSLRVACLFGLSGPALMASSCERAEAASAPVAMDAVMKTIHNYGRGHSGVLSPGSSTKPNEAEDVYGARIGKLMAQEDFAQLEKLAQQDRTEKGRLLGAVWKILAFYDGASTPLSGKQLKDADYGLQITRIKKWIAGYPASTTAHLTLAFLYLHFANLARGTDYGDSVSDSQWGDYNSRTAQAKAILLEASSLEEKDPSWFYALLLVAHNEGWDKAHFRELFDQAVAFEPNYYHYYRAYANYILPQWYGGPGELQDFADEVSSRVHEPNASMLYFQIMSSIACYCEEAMKDLPKIEYPKFKQGYANVTRLFGASNLNANRLAFVAAMFKDQEGAQEAFADIRKMDSEIWYTQQIFDAASAWANALGQ